MFSLCRYSLAYLNVGRLDNTTSFVKGCSFNNGFNTALGVYGTDNLLIEDNVFYHGINELVDIEGVDHQMINNLVALSIAEGTYKVWTLRFVITLEEVISDIFQVIFASVACLYYSQPIGVCYLPMEVFANLYITKLEK